MICFPGAFVPLVASLLLPCGGLKAFFEGNSRTDPDSRHIWR